MLSTNMCSNKGICNTGKLFFNYFTCDSV